MIQLNKSYLVYVQMFTTGYYYDYDSFSKKPTGQNGSTKIVNSSLLTDFFCFLSVAVIWMKRKVSFLWSILNFYTLKLMI